MTRDEAHRFLRRLAHSALATDAMMPLNLRNDADLTPEERAQGEAWRRFRDQPRPRPAERVRPRSCATFRAPCAGPGCSSPEIDDPRFTQTGEKRTARNRVNLLRSGRAGLLKQPI